MLEAHSPLARTTFRRYFIEVRSPHPPRRTRDDDVDMKIFVKAKPSAREEKVEKVDDTNFVVSVREPPVEGQANAAIIHALARYFSIAPSRVAIISGHTSRGKVIEII